MFGVIDKLKAQYSKGECYKEVLILESIAYLYKGQTQKPVDALLELQAKYPDDKEAALHSAKTLNALTMYDQAIAPAKKAAALYEMGSSEHYDMLKMLYTVFKGKEVVWVLDEVIAAILSGELQENRRIY